MRRWRPQEKNGVLGPPCLGSGPATVKTFYVFRHNGGCVRGRTGKNRPLGRGWCNRRVTDVTTVTERAKVTDSMTCSCRVAHAARTEARGDKWRIKPPRYALQTVTCQTYKLAPPKRSKMAGKLGLSTTPMAWPLGRHACATALCRTPANFAQTC